MLLVKKNIKESESKKLEILSAFSLYKKYGERSLLNTYPEFYNTVLKYKECTLQEFIKILDTEKFY